METARLYEDGGLYSTTSREERPHNTITGRGAYQWRKMASTITSERALNEDMVWYEKYLHRLDRLYNMLLTVISAPKFRRLAIFVSCTIAFAFGIWIHLVWPWVEEEKSAWEAFGAFSSDSSHPIYSSNTHDQFGGLFQVKELDASLLPGSPKAGISRRLIFIGDIHGCKKELLELLVKVKYDKGSDHIVSVGDIVTKGPDSLGVVDFLMDQEATSVRGNHDDRVILLAEKYRGLARGESNHVASQTMPREKNGKGGHEWIARALTDEQLHYMQSFPLILKVGQLRKIGMLLVVHGGLVPGVPLDAQDPVSVLNMRSIHLKTHEPTKQHHDNATGTRPWFKIWGKYQRLLPHLDRIKNPKKWKDGLGSKQLTVVYGHDAKMGKQLSRFSKGLDSNCVRGGHLTALVVDEHGKEKIVQVSCHKDYTLEADD